MAMSQVNIQGKKGLEQDRGGLRTGPLPPHIPLRTLLMTPSPSPAGSEQVLPSQWAAPSIPFKTVNPLLVYHTHSAHPLSPALSIFWPHLPLILFPFSFPEQVSPKMAQLLICSVLNLHLRTAPSTEQVLEIFRNQPSHDHPKGKAD